MVVATFRETSLKKHNHLVKNNTKFSFSFTSQAPGVCVSQYNNLVTFLKVDDVFAVFVILSIFE